MKTGQIKWFEDGQLNACYNCVDRHLEKRGDQVALVWEKDRVEHFAIFFQIAITTKISKIPTEHIQERAANPEDADSDNFLGKSLKLFFVRICTFFKLLPHKLILNVWK